jgi:hypothetical protein
VVSNCVFINNSAGDWGGGVNGGNCYGCQFYGNQGTYSGGAYGALLNACVFSGNSGSVDGGAAAACTIYNSTITGNTCPGGIGGVSDCQVTNSIIYYNSGVNYGNYSTLDHCCTIPLPDGSTNCITNEPVLADFAHLAAGSPCRQAGNPTVASGTDIDGEAWLNPPSIGCDEYHAGAITGPLLPAISATYTNVTAGFTVNFIGTITGHASASSWDFGDGTVVSNIAYRSHSWSAVGDYPVVLRAYNEDFPGGVAITQIVHVVPGIYYVARNNSTPAAPYTSWSTAATNLQDAVDAAAAAGTVLVSNGVYDTGGHVVYGAMTNRVALTKPLTLQSINGPLVTIIAGALDPVSTNGDAAVRCVYMGENTALIGFTLTNGATRNQGDGTWEQSGGGVLCTSTGPVVANCVLAGNSAFNVGGGAYLGTLNNCLVTDNSAEGGGGGTYSSSLNNSTVTFNTAPLGAGVYIGTLNNSITYYNNGDNYYADPYYDSVTLSYSCTTPDPGGIGNLTNTPGFVNLAGGDFRLQSNSLCINSGTNGCVTGATDLAGNSRIAGGTVDIGAYEYQTPTSVISYAWLQQYGFAADGSADFTDPDHDGMNNWQEWVAGTNPTDAASLLRMQSLYSDSSGITVTWQSIGGIAYNLQRSSSLSAQPAFMTIQSNIVAGDVSTSYTDATATNSGPYFYRVAVQR